MSKAHQKYDQELSRRKTPQNRERVPGPLMSKTRCKVCGKAIEGMTGGILVGVCNGEFVTDAYAYHDLTYGQRHERENYTDMNTLITYKRFDACCDGIAKHVPSLLQTLPAMDAWCVEGDFSAALEFVERKVPERFPNVDEVFSQHRERLEVLETEAASQRKRAELPARFMGIPHKSVVNTRYGGQAKIAQLLGAVRKAEFSLFRRRSGQYFIAHKCTHLAGVKTILSITGMTSITRWILHPIPEELGIGLRRHGSPYRKVMLVIYSVPGVYNINQVAAALNKLLSGTVLTELQWDTLAAKCTELPAGCSTKDVNDFLKGVIKPIVQSKRLRRV